MVALREMPERRVGGGAPEPRGEEAAAIEECTRELDGERLIKIE